ncbi:hypothetical protein ACVS9P_03555 [Caproicibacterium sp. NSD3]
MKSYERTLKKLIDLSNEHFVFVTSDSSNKLLDIQDLKFLKAKGLIDLHLAGDNEFYTVISNDGITYFSDKHDEKILFIKEHFFNFISGFASGVLVTVVSFLLLQNM